MRIKKTDLLEKIYNICNLNSEDDDIIYKAMYSYKTIREESEQVQEGIYNYIANRLGYVENINNTDIKILNKAGY